MRCRECGQILAGVADGSPCPECGTTGPRLPDLPEFSSAPSIALRFGWPTLLVLLVMPLIAIREDTIVLGGLATLGICVIVGPANTAFQLSSLMRARMPRRQLWAPLVLMTPRVIAVPALAAAATAVINVVVMFGACMVGMPLVLGHPGP